jgi:hypothetical protein
MLVGFDLSPMWVKVARRRVGYVSHHDLQNKEDIIHAFNTSPEYLPDVGSPFATDYRHWHVSGRLARHDSRSHVCADTSGPPLP